MQRCVLCGCWARLAFPRAREKKALVVVVAQLAKIEAGCESNSCLPCPPDATPLSPPGGPRARRHQEPILLTPACSAAMVGGTRGCIRATSSGQSLLRCSAASPRRSTRLIDPTERRQSPPLPGTGDLRGSPAGRCELPRDDDLMSAAGSGAQQTSYRCASSY